MAEKRAQHDAAPQAVSFVLDPNIWDRADAAMKERLQAAAEHITIAMDDGITDPERVAHLARARLITQEPSPTVAEVFEAAPEPPGLKENAKPDDKPRPPQEDRAETPDASGQASDAAEKSGEPNVAVTDSPIPVKCPHCGGPLEDGSSTCPNCKKPLPEAGKSVGDYEKETKEGQTRLWTLLENLTGGDVVECENVLKEIAGTTSLTKLHGTDLKLTTNAVEERIKEKRGRAQQGELL